MNKSGIFLTNLTNSGIYFGEGVVGLGVLVNSLAGSIDVSIIKTGTPLQTLPSGSQILSDYYLVQAGTNVALSPASPLILAVPVPAGAITANLAVAWLPPSLTVLVSDVTSPAWTLLKEKYDPNKNLFLITITSLTSSGITFALVNHANFSSPNNVTFQLSPRISSTGPLQFTVKCVNFPNPTDFTATQEATIADELTGIYNHIKTELLFNYPRLRYQDDTLTFDPNSFSSLVYMVFIEPSTDGYCYTANTAGYYDPGPGRLVLCIDPATGLSASHLQDLIHGYFHATQYGNQVIYTEYLVGLDERWSIEGQAMAAEGSCFFTHMYCETGRSWSMLQLVDVSMKSVTGLDEYDAQYFWDYCGQHNNQDLTYLRNVTSGGAQATDVAKTIGSGDLLDPYWDWVKNQVMEADIDYLGALTTPCQRETNVIQQNPIERFDYTWNIKPYHDVTLGPLTSIVLDLHFDYKYDFGYDITFAVSGSPKAANLDLRYKFYEEEEADCQNVNKTGSAP